MSALSSVQKIRKLRK